MGSRNRYVPLRMKAKTEAVPETQDSGQIRLTKTVATAPPKSGLHSLSENQFPAWDKLVEVSPQGTVFSSSFWLKAIEGNVQVLGCFDRNRLIAGMPLYFTKYFGLKSCVMPPMTPVWGVVMEPLHGTLANCASREMAILKQFATYLASMRLFEQRFHPTLSNWLPFHWNGFNQTSLSTYAVTRLNDLEGLWNELPDTTRTAIGNAEQQGVKIRVVEVSAMEGMGGRSIRGLEAPSADYLSRLYCAAREHKAGECVAAVDAGGNLSSIAFIVWDSKATYHVLGRTLNGSIAADAEMLLMWTLIRDAAKRSASFEFCGFDSESTRQLSDAFVAQPVLCNRITRQPALMRASFSLFNAAPTFS